MLAANYLYFVVAIVLFVFLLAKRRVSLKGFWVTYGCSLLAFLFFFFFPFAPTQKYILIGWEPRPLLEPLNLAYLIEWGMRLCYAAVICCFSLAAKKILHWSVNLRDEICLSIVMVSFHFFHYLLFFIVVMSVWGCG